MHFRLDDSIGYILNRTNTKMKNGLLQILKPYDVTPEQWGILNRLWEREGVSPTELAELISKDPPTTVRMLEKLENKGFIIRQVNPTDLRSHLIYLTNKGRNIKEELIPLVLKTLDQALNGIDPESVKLLLEMLNKIYKNMDR